VGVNQSCNEDIAVSSIQPERLTVPIFSLLLRRRVRMRLFFPSPLEKG